jgi:hypothetical protein
VAQVSPKIRTAQAAPISSWRDVLPVHPAAELFPMMSQDELLELGKDIAENELHTNIVLFEVDKSQVKVNACPVALLDGRNRLDALEVNGHRIDFKKWIAQGKNKDIRLF